MAVFLEGGGGGGGGVSGILLVMSSLRKDLFLSIKRFKHWAIFFLQNPVKEKLSVNKNIQLIILVEAYYYAYVIFCPVIP